MTSEWEKRGFREEEILEHHQKQAFELNSKEIAKRGFAFGLAGFVVSFFSVAFLGELAPIIIGIILNFVYLFFYPKLIQKTLAGDLGFIVVHAISYLIGFFLFSIVFSVFVVLFGVAIG